MLAAITSGGGVAVLNGTGRDLLWPDLVEPVRLDFLSEDLAGG